MERPMSHSFWRRGDSVVWRSRPQGQIGYVMPLTVVVDTAEVTVLFQLPGSICKRRAGARGGPRGRNLLPEAWDGRHEDVVWSGTPNLRLHIWGTAHAIIRSWDFARDCAEGWYVNLEAPWRRTPIGFDTEDLVLDVTVAADLSSWAWKDEDELAWSVEIGKYTAAEADTIRAEGRRVIAAVETRAWPFAQDWSSWRPDPNWPVPVLPENWSMKISEGEAPR
jgi:hypothetical protein